MVDPAIGRVNAPEAAASGPDRALLEGVLRALSYRPGAWRRIEREPARRLRERARMLGCTTEEYLERLWPDPRERAVARRLVAMGEERPWPDGRMLRFLGEQVLPTLGGGRGEARIWVADAAGGALAFTLAGLWALARADGPREVRIVATDPRPECVAQGRGGELRAAARRGLPAELAAALARPEPRAWIAFAPLDLARDPWPFECDLVVMQRSVFRLWGDALRDEGAERAAASLRSHGYLAIGRGEELGPVGEQRFARVAPGLALFRRRH